MSGGSLLRTGVSEPGGRSLEPFLFGPGGARSVEPFSLAGPQAHAAAVEPFNLLGNSTARSVEPFSLLGPVGARSVEPFNLLGPEDFVHPDGSPTSPKLGWWER